MKDKSIEEYSSSNWVFFFSFLFSWCDYNTRILASKRSSSMQNWSCRHNHNWAFYY